MKAGVLAVVAAIAIGVSAGNHHAARHNHEAFHLGRGLESPAPAPNATMCGCTTIYTTITGEGTLYFPPPPATSAPASTPSTISAPPPPSTSTIVVVPTPFATTCPTPGVYTISATTVTLTESTTVCAATSTSIPPGTHTVGGVTTVVSTSTTVVCPYATVSTSSGVVTSTILTTTYVCPSAGTYTIAPHTTTCSQSTVWVYPTPASYAPGTYTQPAVTTTITETDYVVFCPYTSPAPVLASSTYAAPAPPASTSAAAAASPSPSKSSSSGSSSGLGSSGDKWGVTYTPYEDNGSCKSAPEVLVDIALIAASGFSTVRVYSTDCSTLQNVGAACKISGLKLILGVFIDSSGCSGAQQQVTDIISWAQWDLVELIALGNEAIFNGYASGSELAAFVSASASSFKAAGYSGLCTTTEPLNIWQENTGSLCDVVDIVASNIHPFFNADVSANDAGSFVSSQLQIVDNLCPGKTGINLECGWPSAGVCNGIACPGLPEQSTAVQAVSASAGGKTIMFSFTNDLWKAKGDFDCEQSWGMIHLFQ